MNRKRNRLQNLEERIGQLMAHVGKDCPIPALSDHALVRFSEKHIDAAIAKRLAWLRENNEKEVMGRRRY